MKNKNVTFLTQAAMIAAIYVVLTYVFAPFSFGEVQIRISEALTILPLFTPAAIPGLFVGCLDQYHPEIYTGTCYVSDFFFSESRICLQRRCTRCKCILQFTDR